MNKLKLFSYNDWFISVKTSGAGYSVKLTHRVAPSSALEEIFLTEEKWLGLEPVAKNKQLFELFPLKFKTFPRIDSTINSIRFSEELQSLSLVTQKISGEKQIIFVGREGECRIALNYGALTVETFAEQLKKYFNIECNQPILSEAEAVKLSDFEVHDVVFDGAEKVLVDIIREGEYNFEKQAFSKFVAGEIDKATYIESLVLYGNY